MTVHTLLVKISQKLRREVGCNFHYIDAATKANLSKEKNELLEIAERNVSATKIYSGKDILLPIVLDRVFRGIVVVADGTVVNNRDLDFLERFVREQVIENLKGSKSDPDFEVWYKYRDGEVDEDNVIYLSQVKRRKEKAVAIPQKHGGAVFVQAVDADSVQKVAVDIFRERGSSGLVPWFALDPEAVTKIEHINDLGRITIFVSNLAELSETQQELVESYLLQSDIEDSPQFILGSQKSLDVLMSENRVRSGLLGLLKAPRVSANQ